MVRLILTLSVMSLSTSALAEEVLREISWNRQSEDGLLPEGEEAPRCEVDDDVLVIENARVLLEADSGGDLPAGDTVSITRSGTTATVSHTAHGLSTGQKVAIRDADQPEYNGVKTITVTGVDAYTYTVSGAPDTPATGPPNSTAVILSGLTNASGLISTTRSFTSNQPVTGKARKSTASPLYKSQPISDTISSSTGLAATVLLASDE